MTRMRGMFGIPGSEDGSEWVNRVGKRRILTKKEVADLIYRAREGDEKAKRKMVEHNVFLVIKRVGSYARRRKHYHMHSDDLIQEGLMGLLRAIEKFEPERGHAFSTYATWWIDQHLGRAYDDQDLTIRHPVHVKEKIRLFYRIKEELERGTSRDVPLEEVWEEMLRQRPKTSPEVFRVIQTGIVRNPRSLDEPVAGSPHAGHGEHTTSTSLFNFVPDEEAHEEVEKGDMPEGQEDLEAAMCCLDGRRERIVRLRYGLLHEEDYPRTLDEVGKIEGLTRERVRQILLAATVDMRTYYRKRGYEMDPDLPMTVTRAQKGQKAS